MIVFFPLTVILVGFCYFFFNIIIIIVIVIWFLNFLFQILITVIEPLLGQPSSGKPLKVRLVILSACFCHSPAV